MVTETKSNIFFFQMQMQIIRYTALLLSNKLNKEYNSHETVQAVCNQSFETSA
jgi:hypothetical protein